MRPTTLAEVVGQPNLLGPGTLLTRLTEEIQREAGHAPLPSLILWGPPGSGKTTLGRLLAQAWNARLVVLSAVHSGVKDMRKEIDEAQEALTYYRKRTVLFIDEIHRFHKGQQDALLPYVEAGTVALIGATTENPSFEVNAALLSRCRVLRLEALAPADLHTLVQRALTDERGLRALSAQIEMPAEQLLIEQANGDARRALATLEVAAHLTPVDDRGVRLVTTTLVAQALQQRTLLYDRAGDEHYNVISAFIKSMRGSDPDAAVYWLARMLEAGEDLLFVVRRMVIFAAEDIGCADPQALGVAIACMEAVRFVGLPEAVLPLSQAVIYLSTAPKSNSALTTYEKARTAVQTHGALPVPLHLRDAHASTSRALGAGVGYKYPHNFPGHHVMQQYLPDKLREAVFYEPSPSGHEQRIAQRLQTWRTSQQVDES